MIGTKKQQQAIADATTAFLIWEPGWLEGVLENADGHGADLIDPDCSKLANAIRDAIAKRTRTP